MDAKELRIGNFIIYSPEPDLIKMVTGIRIETDMNHKEYERIFFIDKSMKDCRGKTPNWIEPIPLTEEWLLKAAFVRIRDYPVYSLNDFRVELNIIKSEWLADIYIDKVVIKYVHQFQNIYFSLTNEELKFN